MIFALLLLAAPDATRRFALVVGTNDGGAGRAHLRYAASDARAMATVLQELGGVDVRDSILLVDATAATLRAALSDMKQRMLVAARGERLEFILYYSGHSDEEGLLLGSNRVTYPDLRAIVAAMPSDVRVAILDSCASGALLRLKGGQRRQAFLLDASVTPKGHAFITSSSANEAAQESDRIGGSFFTHYFVSGLRGAADVTGDKRVTLNEAYQYAFAETLARTERTKGGAQHASYDIQLAGSGDLVFTDVRSTKAGLVVDETVTGRLFVRDQQDHLVVELNKPAGRSIELGLAGGHYRITNEALKTTAVANVMLSEGRRVALNDSAFLPLEREVTAARGRNRAPEGPVERVAVVALVPQVASHPQDERTRAYVSFQVIASRVHALRGVALGIGVNAAQSHYGAGLAIVGNHSDEHLGVQSALGFNWARQLRGVQTAVLFNGVGGYGEGVQLGLINHAEALSGAQFALLNVGGAVRGFQLGLINVASEMQGFQLGLINVTTKEMTGAQLGLVSYSANVPVRLQLYWSELNAVNAAVRYGSRILYGIVLAGIQPFYGDVRGSYGLGLGVHGALDRFNVDFDVSAHQFLRGNDAFIRPAFFAQARLTVGVQVLERLMPFVGGTANLGYASDNADFDDVSVFRSPATLQAARYWFGLVAGVQL